jgi:hypothetical protein
MACSTGSEPTSITTASMASACVKTVETEAREADTSTALGRGQKTAYEGPLNDFAHLRKGWSEGGAFVEEGAYRRPQFVDLYSPSPFGSLGGPVKENHTPKYRTASVDGTVVIVCSHNIPSESRATNVMGWEGAGGRGGSVVALDRIKPDPYCREGRGNRLGGLREVGM